jgi:hypothetical protein
LEPFGKRLLAAWCDLLDRVDQASPIEWFGTFTFSDVVHPEQADRRFRRYLRSINEELYGRKWREHRQGSWAVRATEYQRRGVLHYHTLQGGGVSKLRRLTWMDAWEEEGGGFARIVPYDRNQGAMRYVSKYAAKGGEIDIFLPPDLEQLLCGGLLQQRLRRA